MKNIILTVTFSLLTFFLILFFVKAQTETVLQPGIATFTLESISLQPVDAEGNPQPVDANDNLLGLTGNLNYLNIFWNARYFSGTQMDMGVKCYLNCENPGEDIETNCAGKQSCSYVGPPGERTCTISNPTYEFKTINKVTCKFYNPAVPAIEYKPYINRTFKPINFEISPSTILTVNLGKPFNLPINLKNTGLFTNNYRVNITAFYPNIVSIDRGLILTDTITTKKITTVYPTITILSTTSPARIGIWTYSTNVMNPACIVKEDCNYMGGSYDCEIASGKCAQYYLVDIKTGVVALPEFDWFGVVQIMLLATIVFAAINFKKILIK